MLRMACWNQHLFLFSWRGQTKYKTFASIITFGDDENVLLISVQIHHKQTTRCTESKILF